MLAGGKGTRLYPISTEDEPKQFLPLLSNQSMLEDSIKRIIPVYGRDSIYINSIDKYREHVQKSSYEALIEPYGVGTTASVLFIVLELMKKHGDSVISLIPSDHYIGDVKKYQEALNSAVDIASDNNNDAVALIGIKPDHAESGYGYINHRDGKAISFTEKPDEVTAKNYINHGYLWNSGIFVFKASTMYWLYRLHLKEVFKGFKYAHSRGFLETFYKIMKINPRSFEKAIMEHANNISVVSGEFDWSDIGDLDRYAKVVGERRSQSWLEKLS